jgi:thiol-disulfide isomerase/thioredoxin
VSAKRLSLLAALTALAVAGCAGGQGAAQPQSGDTRFVPGDGKVEVFAAADRKAAPPIEGLTVDGGTARLRADGTVHVLNFWASWCAPCRAEAPVLKDIAAQTKARGVAFIGVNFKDLQASAQAYDRNVKPGYPSIFDKNGKVLLAFQGTVPPAAIPSTLIIDGQGRIAARALGAVKHSDLLAAVNSIVDEKK